MKKAIVVLSAVLLAGGLLAGEVSATEYAWEAGQQPASAYDGKVTFTYDANDKLDTIRVTEFPDSSKKLTFSGDPMSFKSGNNYVYTVPGEIVFANVVTGNTFFCYLIDESVARKTYGGGNTFLTKDWQTVLADASLEDWTVSPEQTIMVSTGVNPISGWSNPGNPMWACNVKRVGDKVTFQYQTDAYSAQARGDYFSKCVKVEMTNGVDGILARAGATTYAVRSATQADVMHGCYDVDDLATGLTREASELYVQTKASGYGVNTMKFVRSAPIATVRFSAPNGTKQIKLVSPQSFVNIVVDDASTMNVNGTTYPRTYGRLSLRDGSLVWTGRGNGGDGDIYFEATKAIEVEAGTVESEDPDKFFSATELVKVAENRNLRDLLVCTNRAVIVNGTSYPDNVVNDSRLAADENFSWAQMNGSYLGDKTTSSTANHKRHPGNLYNLKFNDKYCTNATVQVQCQQQDMIRCFYLSLYQIGNDIYACAKNTKAAYSVKESYEATQAQPWYSDKFLGVDYDLVVGSLSGLSTEERKNYGYTHQISTWSGTDYSKIDGIGVRDLKLVFKKPTKHLINSKNRCEIAGGNYVVSGRDDTTMALQILDPGGLPTNGTVTVKSGGELWFANAYGGNGILGGVSKGTCDLLVEKGGLVRQRGQYPFGSGQKIVLTGGKILFEGANSSEADNGTYFNTVTLKDGSLLASSTARGVRLGNDSTDCKWRVSGSAPSTNAAAIMPFTMSSPYPVHNWVLDVAGTGDFAADFVQEGEIRSYAKVDSSIPAERLRNLHVRKVGAGTMLLTGDYSHPGLLEVTAGRFVLGASDIWSGGAPLAVQDGATLEAAAGTENETLGALTVGENGAALVLGEGATMAFADSKASAWEGRVNVAMPTNSIGEVTATLKFTGGVTEAQRKMIRINGRRADVTDDGRIIPGNFGLMLILR